MGIASALPGRRANLFHIGLLVGAVGLPALAQQPEPLGAEFQVNTYTSYSQWFPSVGMDAAGGFVVVWQSDRSSGTDTSSLSIQAQRYASDATPLASEFR